MGYLPECRGAFHSSHRISPEEVRWRGRSSWSSWGNVSVMCSQYWCAAVAWFLKECVFESVSIGREQLEFTQVSSCCVLTCCCVCCWIATHCTLLGCPSALLAAVFQYLDASFTNPLLPEARSRWRVKESPDLHCYIVSRYKQLCSSISWSCFGITF